MKQIKILNVLPNRILLATRTSLNDQMRLLLIRRLLNKLPKLRNLLHQSIILLLLFSMKLVHVMLPIAPAAHLQRRIPLRKVGKGTVMRNLQDYLKQCHKRKTVTRPIYTLSRHVTAFPFRIDIEMAMSFSRSTPT